MPEYEWNTPLSQVRLVVDPHSDNPRETTLAELLHDNTAPNVETFTLSELLDLIHLVMSLGDRPIVLGGGAAAEFHIVVAE